MAPTGKDSGGTPTILGCCTYTLKPRIIFEGVFSGGGDGLVLYGEVVVAEGMHKRGDGFGVEVGPGVDVGPGVNVGVGVIII